jgi:chemotaxis response regulator CheB
MADASDHHIRALVVSLPGITQKVLIEMFIGRADVDLVGVACGGLSAVGLIHQKQPVLVVIDASLPDSEASALVEWIKEQQPQVCSLVLAETTHQLKRAAISGADLAFRSYSLPDKLDWVLASVKANQNRQEAAAPTQSINE